jgi:large subunit ribosomal protein L18
MLVKGVRRQKIKYRIRKSIIGTAERPRLSVFRSNKDIYVQLIDDSASHTIVAASSKGAKSGNKVDQAKKVGTEIAQKALAAGITEIVFDRGGYLYHGRVKAISDGAREAGLKF